MQKIEPPDAHHLSAAIGWLELGNMSEAEAELNRVSATLQCHPDVLEVRWVLAAEAENWDAGLQVARTLVKMAPGRSSGWLHQAYAIRRATGGGVRAAQEALLPAFGKFPKEPTIPYNLSCYACQLNNLDEARVWLQRAFEAGDKDTIKTMALADLDLKPLWEEIRTL
jgi:hypothetical protein